MLIDKAFCVDNGFADLSDAAEGVYGRLCSFCYLSGKDAVRRENLPRYERETTKAALQELIAAGMVLVHADGTIEPSALEGALHAPPPSSYAPSEPPRPFPPGEAPSALATKAPRKGAKGLSRSEAASVAARARHDRNRMQSHGASALQSHDANASQSHGASASNARPSEKEKEIKEEDLEMRDAGARTHATASVERLQSHSAIASATASPHQADAIALFALPYETPGEKTVVREGHRAVVPDWALQRVESDAIGTGKRPADVPAVWARFIDHWISDGKASQSWGAEWRKWLGNERTRPAGAARSRLTQVDHRPPGAPLIDWNAPLVPEDEL